MILPSLNYELFLRKKEHTVTSRPPRKKNLEVETESPEAYVKENGRFPIQEITKNSSGDIVITTGDGKGNMVKYTFTE